MYPPGTLTSDTQRIDYLKQQQQQLQQQEVAAGVFVVASWLTKGAITFLAGPALGPTPHEQAVARNQQAANDAAAHTAARLRDRAATAGMQSFGQAMQASVLQAMVDAAANDPTRNAMPYGGKQASLQQVNNMRALAQQNAHAADQLRQQAAQAALIASTPVGAVNALRPNVKGIAASGAAGLAHLGLLGAVVNAVKANVALAENEVALDNAQAAAGVPPSQRLPTVGLNPIVLANRTLQRGVAQGGKIGQASALALVQLQIALGGFGQPPPTFRNPPPTLMVGGNPIPDP